MTELEKNIQCIANEEMKRLSDTIQSLRDRLENEENEHKKVKNAYRDIVTDIYLMQTSAKVAECKDVVGAIDALIEDNKHNIIDILV